MMQCQDDSSLAESFPSHGYCVHLKYYTNLLHLILMDKVSILCTHNKQNSHTIQKKPIMLTGRLHVSVTER